MKHLYAILFVLLLSPIWAQQQPAVTNDFKYEVDQFADVRILRYQVPGFENLTLQQKLLCYYVAQAGYCGRDITYDQGCKYNLTVRRTIEQIVKYYEGNRDDPQFKKFLEYAKRVWMSNGIHHHSSSDKLIPGCDYWVFVRFVRQSPKAQFPLRSGEKLHEFVTRMYDVMFDPAFMPKKVNQTKDIDIVANSAVNFHEGVTNAEVDAFYKNLMDPNDKTPPSWGLNSKLVKIDGKVVERTWKVGGMYGEALIQIVYWLEKAAQVAENDKQRQVIESLIKYYKTGNLRDFDQHSILWVQDTESTVNFINGFIEVYNDPKGMRGSFESVVEVVDPEMTAKIGLLSKNAQWFEDNAPILPQHKKEKITGIEWRAINVVAESGDSSPATAIGINLPNAEWIRETIGSKSVNLANIVFSYNQGQDDGLAKEFFFSQEEVDRHVKYRNLADDLAIAMHELIGHASGKLEAGVSDPQALLGHYASVLEEMRAELFALYYLLDPKLIELGLMSSLEVGQAAYDDFIVNGLLIQLQSIQLGKNVEQTHMRARQAIVRWVYENGLLENVVEKKIKDGKTYFVINDYEKLRKLFGDLLREVQRIKSQGDKNAGVALVENYGVKVDATIHQEVLDRFKGLKSSPPYAGFINPRLVPVYKEGEIIDVKIEYPDNFVDQMMEYGEKYSYLPNEN